MKTNLMPRALLTIAIVFLGFHHLLGAGNDEQVEKVLQTYADAVGDIVWIDLNPQSNNDQAN